MIKQTTTYTFTFLMVLTSDHLSPATGKTVTVNLSKAGAAFGAAAGAVTEIGNGWYKCAFTTADTGTLGDLSINATAAACDPTDTREQIVAFDPLAAANLGLTNLDAAVSSRSTYAGGAVASVTGAVGSVTAAVTVGTNNDKTGYTASTVSDKTGYALTAGEHTAVVADVNTALDAAGAELAAVPGQTATVRQSLRFLFQYFRNKRTVTASVETLYKEDSVTALGTAAISDDGTTASFAKAA